MYISDKTFKQMFIEVLETQDKGQLIDIILNEIPDYKQEDIVKYIYDLEEGE